MRPGPFLALAAAIVIPALALHHRGDIDGHTALLGTAVAVAWIAPLWVFLTIRGAGEQRHPAPGVLPTDEGWAPAGQPEDAAR